VLFPHRIGRRRRTPVLPTLIHWDLLECTRQTDVSEVGHETVRVMPTGVRNMA
jgi:hypothetical protein